VIVVDVNLLLYAVISGFPQHEVTRAWWEDTLNSSTEVGLAAAAIFGFLRISTNPRVLGTPLSVEEATDYINEWLDLPNVCLLTPGRRHFEIALDLLRGVGTAGNLTTDAQLAALAIEHEADMCSNDTDFGRFQGLRWVNPLKG
jgi:toxin-antitoxin system PIN domain toxin